ncbi:TonB-dependent receptor plug domain-containing protein [Henriciella sp.]|uniref:TonB-dependent receptor plug domain-containing protein n=1 Tax=Henriciella sp. TaxID=1968823 RepID=UPI0026269DF9|nr:TonB-dependent receptor plug domain-containing protein [Henriciella sp.]
MNRYFLGGTCAAALAFALPAVGQVADTNNTSNDGQEAAAVQDTITVTGYRASWTRALQNKRAADDIRDVITSTEVGELPDQNVAEAIQRVPGVSITRDQGEGQFVTIRGLPPEFSRTTINGMTATSSDNGRAVPLDLFASDLFSTIEIVKSPSAEDTEGGLSGQINLITHDPGAVNKPLFSADVAGFYNDLSGELGPKLSLIGANEFLDGKLSALAAVAYSDRSVRQDVLASGGWNSVGDLIGGDLAEDVASAQMWENGQLRMFEEDRERLGLLGAVSFSPTNNQTYELNALYSKYDLLQTKYQFLNKFKAGSSIEDVRLEDDTVVAATFRDATIGSNNQRRSEERDSLILTGSGEWALDQWLVEAGLGWSETNVETPEDLKYVWEGTADMSYDLADPYAPVFGYPNTSVEEIYSSPELYTSLKQIVVENRDVEDAEGRLYADIERTFDLGSISAIKGGFEYRSRQKQQSAAQFKDKSKPKTSNGVSPLSDYVGYHEGEGSRRASRKLCRRLWNVRSEALSSRLSHKRPNHLLMLSEPVPRGLPVKCGNSLPPHFWRSLT